MNLINKTLLILFLTYSHAVFCKSDKNVISKYTHEDIQKKALHSLEQWNHYLRNNLDSLKLDASKIYRLGIENGNELAVNAGKRSFGSYLIRTGQQIKGIEYLKAANTYFESKNNSIIQTEILNEIGNGYLYMGKPIEAEKYYLKSLKCGKNSPDPSSSFLAEANLAQAYINLGNLEKANAILHHYKNEALKINKLESVSTSYALLGIIEQRKGNNNLSKEYYQKSADYGFKSNAVSLIAQAYNNMAIVFFQNNNLNEALEYFTKALEIRLKTKNVRSISESYFNIGGYYHEIKDYSKALNYYQICLNFCEKNNLIKEQMEAVYSMMELDKAQGKFESALDKMEDYIAIQEKYFSELAKSKTEDTELIELFDKLEIDQQSKNQQYKFSLQLEKQKYHTNILYIVFSICIAALILLVFYKKRIN